MAAKSFLLMSDDTRFHPELAAEWCEKFYDGPRWLWSQLEYDEYIIQYTDRFIIDPISITFRYEEDAVAFRLEFKFKCIDAKNYANFVENKPWPYNRTEFVTCSG